MALVAENGALKKSEVEFNDYCRRECEDVGDTWVDDFTVIPATDAFLAEMRAQGVDEFATELGNVYQQLRSGSNHAHAIKSAVFRAVEFAAQLRKGSAL